MFISDPILRLTHTLNHILFSRVKRLFAASLSLQLSDLTHGTPFSSTNVVNLRGACCNVPSVFLQSSLIYSYIHGHVGTSSSKMYINNAGKIWMH